MNLFLTNHVLVDDVSLFFLFAAFRRLGAGGSKQPEEKPHRTASRAKISFFTVNSTSCFCKELNNRTIATHSVFNRFISLPLPSSSLGFKDTLSGDVGGEFISKLCRSIIGATKPEGQRPETEAKGQADDRMR